MKKIYEIPELEIICFAPWEKLAADDFGASYFAANGGNDGMSGVEETIFQPSEDPEGGID